MGLGFRVWGGRGPRNAHDTPIPLSFISLAKPAFGCAQSFDTGLLWERRCLGFVRTGFERNAMGNFVEEIK
jgi:hypothetical protein